MILLDTKSLCCCAGIACWTAIRSPEGKGFVVCLLANSAAKWTCAPFMCWAKPIANGPHIKFTQVGLDFIQARLCANAKTLEMIIVKKPPLRPFANEIRVDGAIACRAVCGRAWAQGMVARIGHSTAQAAVWRPGTGLEPHANPRLPARMPSSP